jgi:uncharacterized membrane protein YbhN (UPF0104 family)
MSAGRVGSVVRRVAPWLVAIGLLGLLVRRIGGEEILRAFAAADVGYLLLATLVCTAINFSLDAYSLSRAISWFNAPMPFTRLVPVKASAYLVGILNYNVASGGIALWIARRCRVPFLEAVSTMLFVNAVDALLLIGLMAAGLPVLREPVAAAVFTIAAVAVPGFVAQYAFWLYGERLPVLGRLWGWPIFASFRRARLSLYAKLAAMRLAFLLVFIANYWFAVQAFHLDIPPLQIIAAVPVISFVGIVPVTVMGLGTVQAATIYLFADYASEASLLALSLAVTAVMTALRALLGLPFFAGVSQELLRPRDAAPDVS